MKSKLLRDSNDKIIKLRFVQMNIKQGEKLIKFNYTQKRLFITSSTYIKFLYLSGVVVVRVALKIFLNVSVTISI